MLDVLELFTNNLKQIWVPGWRNKWACDSQAERLVAARVGRTDSLPAVAGAGVAAACRNVELVANAAPHRRGATAGR
jgi:hypothetical protein